MSLDKIVRAGTAPKLAKRPVSQKDIDKLVNAALGHFVFEDAGGHNIPVEIGILYLIIDFGASCVRRVI